MSQRDPVPPFLGRRLETVAYLRVSTRSQDLANQKLAILEFSQKRRFPIDQFIESRISSRKSPLERRIDEMLGTLQPGDPARSLRADPKARTALMLYFNTNVGATL